MSFERTKTTYELEQVLLISERLKDDVDLRRVVTDLEIYENLDKPYLTAEMSVVDQTGFFEQTGIIGGERVEIDIVSLSEGGPNVTISKKFYVVKCDKRSVNDDAQLVIFNLIEDIGFISKLYNVNRAVSGKPGKILNTIAKEFFDRSVVEIGSEIQRFEAIIPNMNPLDAMRWISRRAATSEGYPHYLYSTLVSDNSLYFNDLGRLLLEPVINPDQKFSNTQASLDNPLNKTIVSHLFEDNKTLLEFISRGLIGSQYEYIDTTQETTRKFKFDVIKDFLSPLVEAGVLSQQENVEFSELYKVKEKSFNERPSRYITRIGGTNSNRDFFVDEDKNHTWTNSLYESKDAAGYKAQVIQQVMDTLLKKSPATFVMDGSNFIAGDRHLTVGCNIAVEFTKTNPDRDFSIDQIDTRRSGNYLIFACRHMFKKEKYEVSLGCMKLGDLKRND